MKYIVVRDCVGRYVFIPVSRYPADCSGFVRMSVKRLSRR